MAVCEVCGKQYGMFGGGEEVFTGKGLKVCNKCDGLMKDIDRMRELDQQKCQSYVRELIALCSDERVISIIRAYSEKGYDKSKVVENESRKNRENEKILNQQIEEYLKNFKYTTGYGFEGYTIREYKEMISGEAIVDTGFVDVFSGAVSHVVGAHKKIYSLEMQIANKEALKEMIKNAAEQRVNAMIGVRFNYIALSDKFLGVTVSGTGVVIEKEE